MSIALRPYENLLRPAHETWAVIGWGVSSLVTPVMWLATNAPLAPFLAMTAISIFMCAIRAKQTYRLWRNKVSLCGYPFSFMRTSLLKQLIAKNPESVWLGAGWDWKPEHTQQLYEVKKRNLQTILPPKWFLKLIGMQHMLKPFVGLPWLHGLNQTEDHVYVPHEALEGHTLIFGTTGAGKTRMFEILIVQAIMRGETVVIVDPKGDKELKDIAQRACQIAGRPDSFVEFNPAHPACSVRLDPLRNWNNVTELASRIAALMPSESGSDTFTQMAWKAVYVVAEALVYTDQMPTLVKLRRYIEGGPERLMEQSLRVYFQRNVPHWESLLAPLLQRARDGKLPSKAMGTPELTAYMAYYKNDIPEERRAPEIDGLLAMVEHNREHLGKILASLVPLLVMLTAGEIGKMLSPDTTDINDDRTILDTKKIVNSRHVLYLGLNSLSNSTVGSAIGSIVLADFAAVAGEIYNYGKRTKINLLVDEAAEVVNIPLIQILNKARGAGFVTYLAAQTLPDFIARMGNEARARQILGNCNNLISLRVKDRLTQEFIVETIGETEIQIVSRGMSSGVRPDDKNLDIDRNTNITKSINEQTVEVFPPAMLGMLPNLEYIAFVSGGRLIKGRLPKLTETTKS